MKQVHIGHDFFGAGNIGDDLMLAGFIHAVKKHGLQADFTCCTPHDISSQQKRFPEINWVGPDARLACLRECDIWLGLGGTPFQTSVGLWLLNSICQDLRVVSKADKPAYMLGVGVNDLESLEMEQSKEILGQLRGLWARDQSSADSLSSISDGKIYSGSDLAHVYLGQRAIKEMADDPLLGVILHVESMALINPEIVESSLNSLGIPNLWIAQEVRDLCYSERFLYDIIGRKANSSLVVPDYHASSLEALIYPWTLCSTFLCSRYHGAVIGAWMQKPVSVFARSFKLQGLIEELNLTPCRSLTNSEHIVSSIREATIVSKELLKCAERRALKACVEFFRDAGLIQGDVNL